MRGRIREPKKWVLTWVPAEFFFAVKKISKNGRKKREIYEKLAELLMKGIKI